MSEGGWGGGRGCGCGVGGVWMWGGVVESEVSE